jgi:external thioesterase TEII
MNVMIGKPQLFLIHFSGGNCYSYQFLRPFLPMFDIVALELPGRCKRIKEPLLTDFDLAAADIYQQVLASLQSPDFLIYGHSMGSLLALRVANMLEAAGKPPASLVVSGNAGPDVEFAAGKRKRYLLEQNEFIKELKRLGGVPEEVLGNKELFDFFEPVLRADFEVSERTDLSGEKPVGIPLYAIMGSREDNVEEITSWKKYTSAQFDFEVMDGDHFFIRNHPEKIAAVLKKCLYRAAIMV